MHRYEMNDMVNASLRDRERDTAAFLRSRAALKSRAEDGATPGRGRHRRPHFGLAGVRHAGAGLMHLAGGHR
ncbi:MAG: hypothetical protein ACKVT1_08855 [Dehalococcoidia bacterium]